MQPSSPPPPPESPAPRRIAPQAPFIVVMNAGSGRREGGSNRDIVAAVLREAGRPHEIRLVEQPGELPAVARRAVAEAKARSGVVVAAGGDGTLNAVVQQVLGSGCAFGAVPLGTFNYFGRTHGLPLECEPAVRALLQARAHPVQVGLVNDRVFLVNASLGLYPKVLEDREAYKSQYGRSRGVALLAALATLLRNHRQLRLQIDYAGTTQAGSGSLRTPTVFIGNNRLQLEQIGIQAAPRVEQGELVAITLRPVSTLAMLGLMLRGAMGSLGSAEQVLSFPLQRMTVRPTLLYPGQRVKVATDGETAWLRAPLTFRPAPEPLWLLKADPAADSAAAPVAP